MDDVNFHKNIARVQIFAKKTVYIFCCHGHGDGHGPMLETYLEARRSNMTKLYLNLLDPDLYLYLYLSWYLCLHMTRICI